MLRIPHGDVMEADRLLDVRDVWILILFILLSSLLSTE